MLAGDRDGATAAPAMLVADVCERFECEYNSSAANPVLDCYVQAW